MPLALCCLSHSPLLDISTPKPDLLAEINLALSQARNFAAAFDPDVVVLFAPDHYNGFFYKLMPQFCIGYEASGIGDYGTEAGEFDVPRELAEGCAQSALDAGIDLAVSLKMEVDHGAVQPLEKVLGGLRAKPVVPIFVNSVAAPLGPIARARRLGEAIGEYLARRPERILLIGSGGLSHDAPVPTLASAPADVAERLITGNAMTSTQRQERTDRVIAAANDFAAGTDNLRPLNPVWDRALLDLLATGNLEAVDSWSNKWIEEQAGGSAHEVRTWVAAFAALAAAGGYEVTSQYYRAIPEFIAGFAVTTARPTGVSMKPIGDTTQAGEVN
ncbi:3-carboxyethylcatechol 2,3-dioxygenase [Rhodococcus wratislaviensis]|uniref:2,3-dihydroxyphenylpropionate/2,3-dihydroxicinnamic acid 1,2-dioxygenase n=1 Tax=Rhodococcus wratislaviensis TaxID=44752 RepID=A0A402CMF5_RHOWR|nr:3-carboxyethylcatechol 2,3-dioxygenase [Rhodococcus wratislaviensis]GCE44817.1 3-carboxyethylcatechol 2,3-dioxygenase [Rhodococcus wratislaviensis]